MAEYNGEIMTSMFEVGGDKERPTKVIRFDIFSDYVGERQATIYEGDFFRIAINQIEKPIQERNGFIQEDAMIAGDRETSRLQVIFMNTYIATLGNVQDSTKTPRVLNGFIAGGDGANTENAPRVEPREIMWKKQR